MELNFLCMLCNKQGCKIQKKRTNTDGEVAATKIYLK